MIEDSGDAFRSSDTAPGTCAMEPLRTCDLEAIKQQHQAANEALKKDVETSSGSLSLAREAQTAASFAGEMSALNSIPLGASLDNPRIDEMGGAVHLHVRTLQLSTCVLPGSVSLERWIMADFDIVFRAVEQYGVRALDVVHEVLPGAWQTVEDVRTMYVLMVYFLVLPLARRLAACRSIDAGVVDEVWSSPRLAAAVVCIWHAMPSKETSRIVEMLSGKETFSAGEEEAVAEALRSGRGILEDTPTEWSASSDQQSLAGKRHRASSKGDITGRCSAVRSLQSGCGSLVGPSLPDRAHEMIFLDVSWPDGGELDGLGESRCTERQRALEERVQNPRRAALVAKERLKGRKNKRSRQRPSYAAKSSGVQGQNGERPNNSEDGEETASGTGSPADSALPSSEEHNDESQWRGNEIHSVDYVARMKQDQAGTPAWNAGEGPFAHHLEGRSVRKHYRGYGVFSGVVISRNQDSGNFLIHFEVRKQPMHKHPNRAMPLCACESARVLYHSSLLSQSESLVQGHEAAEMTRVELFKTLVAEPKGDFGGGFFSDAARSYFWEINVKCSRHWSKFDVVRYIPFCEMVPEYPPEGPEEHSNRMRKEQAMIACIDLMREEHTSLEKQLLSNGVRYQVEVYDTKTARGWGVRALEPIPPDQPVMEYVGQVIKRAETERREKLYSDEGRQGSYMFCIPTANVPDAPAFSIDATTVGNVARFVNHACHGKVNLRLTPVRVALISTRAIKAGEELLYCYTSNDGEAAFPVSRQLECHCGAIDCRGYVF